MHVFKTQRVLLTTGNEWDTIVINNITLYRTASGVTISVDIDHVIALLTYTIGCLTRGYMRVC